MAVLFILAIAGCFVAFKKESRSVIEKTQPEPAKETAVKGTEKEGSTTEQFTSDYSRTSQEAHMGLTPANIIWFTNYYRYTRGFAPLTNSKILFSSSTDKASDMFAYQYFEHTRPDSSITFDTFFTKEGYDYIKIGENLAMGNFDSSKEVVEAWMKSAEHKKNILDPNYREIGVSIVKGTMNGRSTYVFVQHFGKPQSACPAVPRSLESGLAMLERQIANLKSSVDAKEGEVSKTSVTDFNYNALVAEYNSMADAYNKTIDELATEVKQYNAAVKKYDLCVKGS